MFVIVRTYSAGVHCGELEKQNGKEVTLINARRIWRWRGANTLNEIANHGVDQEYSRISEMTTKVVLTEAIEILECTNEATLNLQNSRWSQ